VPESIGAYLSRQRQLRGISLEELAEATRIPRRSLQRLEGGAFDERPDGFVRGFVRTVAAALGLEPDDAVNRMLAEPEAAMGRAASRGRARLALALVVLAVLALAPLAWIRAAAREPAAAGTAETAADADLVMRRDVVRELADSLRARSARDPSGS
jgi:cytoskeletal protein RodZ